MQGLFHKGMEISMTEDEMKNKEYEVCAIDCDVVAFRAAAGAQKRHYAWVTPEGDVIEEFNNAKEAKEYKTDAEEFFGLDTSEWARTDWLVVKEEDVAIKAADNILKDIMSEVKSKKYLLYMTGDDNHRDRKAEVVKYKVSREDMVRPERLKAVRRHILDNHGAKIIEGLECDDVISVVGYKGYVADPESPKTCIVNIDKDLFGTPLVNYDFVKNEWKYITEYEANKWMFIQILMGDSIDDIRGLPNISTELRKKYGCRKGKSIGEKTAEKILEGSEDIQEMYRRTLECYIDYYGYWTLFKTWYGKNVVRDASDMLDEQAELVFMMRHRDEFWSDFKKREILGD